MLQINQSSQFRRDVKRQQKRGLDMDKLKKIIIMLAEEKPLPANLYDHSLKGVWSKYRELHIAPDWLLIYRIDADVLYLTQTGSHDDLFKE